MALIKPNHICIKQITKRPALSVTVSIFIFIVMILMTAIHATATTGSKSALTISMETTSARAMGSLERRFGQVNDLLYLYSANETATLIELAFPGELIVAPDKTRLGDLLADASTDIRINVEPVALDRLFEPEATPAAKVLNKQKQLVGIIATREAMETFRTGAVVRSSQANEDVDADKDAVQAMSHTLKSTSSDTENAHAVKASKTADTSQSIENKEAADNSGHTQAVAVDQASHGSTQVSEEKHTLAKNEPLKEAEDHAKSQSSHSDKNSPGHSSDHATGQPTANETAKEDDHSVNQKQEDDHQKNESHTGDATTAHSETEGHDGHAKEAHGPTFDDSLPRGVALIEAIIQPMNYELNERFWGWRVNDLIRIGDNVKNFQLGVLEITRRSAIILSERVSRTGESSRFDPQLENAMNWFMIKPNRYWFPSAESKYQDALDALAEYKERLAKKQAKFFNRADNLIPLLMAYEDLLGSCEENLVKVEEEDGTPVSFFKADDYLYYTKGVSSALLTILKGIEHDFADVIGSRQALGDIHHAIESCHHAVEIDPILVMNNDSSSIFANHRANQAAPLSHARFYLSVLIKALST